MLVVFGGEELNLLLKSLAEAVKPLFAGHHIAFVRLGLLAKLRNVAEFLFFAFFFACAFRRHCSTLHQIASSNFFFFRQSYCLCELAVDGGFFFCRISEDF